MTAARNPKTSRSTPAQTDEAGFAEIVELIASSRERGFQAVNTVLIDLYWKVGEIISRKIEAAQWGDSTVETRNFLRTGVADGAPSAQKHPE